MSVEGGPRWSTDPVLLRSVDGADQVEAWFGRFPSFHDAKLKSLELASGAAAMRLHAFRMTDKVDDKGFFVLDKHALVSFEMADVTGLALRGDAYSTISRLEIRRLDANSDELWPCTGPRAGDFEIAFNSSYGLEGSIYGRELRILVQPLKG